MENKLLVVGGNKEVERDREKDQKINQFQQLYSILTKQYIINENKKKC